jgi:NADH:ubiquinone reductase (H+-translocating)
MSAAPRKPRVVIVGAGFGGLFAAKSLARAEAEVVVIDRHNYHLFQPLLYQVATAGLPASDIAWPIRSMLRRQRNTAVLMDVVTAIDLERRQVVLRDRRVVGFDYLVVATGATHSYFGHEEWQEVAPGLKSIDDATGIRRRILTAFERAEMATDPDERERLLRFVIVGGGPTGVELAGAISELAHFTLAKDFRTIDPRGARILLAEAGPRVLPAFDSASSEYARAALERLRVDVRVGSPVTELADDELMIGGEKLRAATVIWAAGVAASPAASWLGVETDRAGRVIVDAHLSVPGQPKVFVIGDAALVKSPDGAPVPGIAPAAKQEGRYVARAIMQRIAGRDAGRPFRYRHAGNLATIGRRAAVIEFSRLHLKGRLAWWVWGISHIYFLVGVRSPLLVTLNWLWQYLTYAQGARLITGDEQAR